LTAIPNGAIVRFLRSAHSAEHFEAIVRQSHRLAGDAGHHYEIDCAGFPFIIGFASDEELFTDVRLANLASTEAKHAATQRIRAKLLVEKTRIEAALKSLDDH
jgi:hypothetical protein